MSIRSWAYSLRTALKSVTHTGLMSLASVSTVAISLLVLAVVLLIAANLQQMASTMESQVQIKVYLKDNQTEEVKKGLQLRVSATPGVISATFISKEQALEQVKNEFKDQRDVLDGLDEVNPLRDSIDVKAADPTQVPALADTLTKLPGVAEADYGKGTVDKLLKFTQAVRATGIGLTVLLLIATMFTISNTIRLAVYARRREIQIMKLVGATDWFIRLPFIFEGILLGALGAAVSLAITAFGYSYIVSGVATTMPFLPLIRADQIVGQMSVSLVALGCFLGAVGSIISLRRFLSV